MSAESMKKIRRNDQGFYLAVSVVVIAVLLIVLALVFGVGRITADKARLQAINNVIAMASIQAFMNCDTPTLESSGTPEAIPGCTAVTLAGKQSAARSAANKFAQLNRLQGAANLLGDIDVAPTGGAGGTLFFGRWVESGESCDDGGANYPCFHSIDHLGCSSLATPGCEVNSVRINFNTQSSNPILTPLREFLGAGGETIRTTSTSTVVPRCAAFVLDASRSTASETHQQYVNGVTTKDQASSFSYRSWSALPDPTWEGFDCSSKDTSSDPYYWCDYMDQAFPSPDVRNRRVRVANETGGGFPKHYWSDYRNSVFPADAIENPLQTRQHVLVDHYVEPGIYEGPQPLTSYLTAFNAGLQQLQHQSVGGDKALILGFRDRIAQNQIADTAKVPNTNFGFLMQLTNPNNRGLAVFDPLRPDPANLHPDDYFPDASNPLLRPNFIDADWYPRFPEPVTEQTGTDIYGALEEALNQLATCPVRSKKLIVIATDGIPNCSGPSGFPQNPNSFCTSSEAGNEQWSLNWNAAPTCKNSYCSYMFNEKRLLDTSPGSLLSRMLASKVAVTVLLRGQYVKPNIINVMSPTTGKRMEQNEAQALGYGGPTTCGGTSPCIKKYFDYTSGNDQSDFNQMSTDPVNHPFLRPNGLMGELAFITGGIWCPLQNRPSSDASYTLDPKLGIKALNDAARTLSATETRPLFYLSPAGQAVKCVKDAIGGIPFTLVEETR